jgi:Domain of unknown function (DUF5103)
MRVRLKALAVIILISTSTLGQKNLSFIDQSYESEIRTVMLHPDMGAGSSLRPAVAVIQNQNLLLEFDDLQSDRSNYYVKIIHCNANWTKSSLMDLDFLFDYNEFPITEYDASFNTSLPYIHYYFRVPPVKIPGNYLLVAYREGDENDLLLSKRFMVYDNLVSLVRDTQIEGTGTLNASNQQLNFKINYMRLDVTNPMESFHVVIRQNQRWDNARMNVKPSFVREDKRELEYRFFDQDKQYMAGNEFRFVDFRSLNFPGQNTGRLNRSKRPFHLSVITDKSREGLAYGKYRDMNGGYVIENLDTRDAAISCDYLFVTFSIVSSPVNGQVYLVGAMNNWNRTEENKMVYNKENNQYEVTLFLKQGFYDYQYWVESNSSNGFLMEGSHFETENLYEVLIYNRPFKPNADILVGYYPIPVNPR